MAERAGAIDAGNLMLSLSVRDSGPGIAPDKLPTIFERFAPGDTGEHRQFGGTGLGLAIARQLTELMGGRLSVESTVGVGSTFTLELPLQRAGKAAAPAPLAAPPADGGAGASGPRPQDAALSVLAVDDNHVNLLVVEQFLAGLGHRARLASGGDEALQALRTEPFDLVLIDMHMPLVGGLDVLYAVRKAAGPNRLTPMIALTADVTSGDRAHYVGLGFTDHLAKPLRREHLIEAIDRLRAPPAAGRAATA